MTVHSCLKKNYNCKLYGSLSALFILSHVAMGYKSVPLTIFTTLLAIATTGLFWKDPIYMAFSLAVPFGVSIMGYSVFPFVDVYILIGLLNIVPLYSEIKKLNFTKYCRGYVIAFVVLMVVSTMFGQLTKTGIISFVRELSYLAFLVVSASLIKKTDDFKRLTIGIVVFSLLSCAAAYGYMALTNSLGSDARGAVRIINISWPNYYGIFLTVVSILALCLMYIGQQKERIFGVISFILLLVSILFTYSRGAYLVSELALALFILLIEKKWLRKIALVMLVILFFTFTPTAQQRMSATVDKTGAMGVDNASYSRIARIIASVDYLKGHPTIALVGAGFRSTEHVITTVYNENLKREIPMGSSHNDYLDRVVRVGVIGLLVWAWLFLSLCYKLLARVIGKVGSPERTIFWAITTGLIGLAVAGLTEVLFKNPHIVALVWVFVGAASSLLEAQNSKSNLASVND